MRDQHGDIKFNLLFNYDKMFKIILIFLFYRYLAETSKCSIETANEQVLPKESFFLIFF